LGDDLIRVGVIGAGFIGELHTEILSKNEQVELVGFFDSDRKKSELLAKRYKAKSYPTYQTLIESSEVDAVYICTPNAFHAEPALYALKEGIHVFSEKPPAVNLEDAKRIVEVARESKCVYQVGYNYHFSLVHKKVKELVQKEKFYLADIKMVRGEFIKPSWLKSPEISGGLLYETTSHVLYFLRWLFGDVAKVICLAKSNIYNQLDDFVISLQFKNDILASVTSSAHASWFYPFERIEIFGDHSTISTQEFDRVTYSSDLKEVTISWDFTRLPFEEKRGYTAEDENFIKAIIENKRSPVDAEAGLKIVELIEACYESARKGGKEIVLG